MPVPKVDVVAYPVAFDPERNRWVADVQFSALGLPETAWPLRSRVMSSAPPHKAGAAGSLASTAGELGVALGVATLGIIGTAPNTVEIECNANQVEAVPEQDTNDTETFCGIFTSYKPAKWTVTITALQSFGADGLWNNLRPLVNSIVDFEIVPDLAKAIGADNVAMTGKAYLPEFAYLSASVGEASDFTPWLAQQDNITLLGEAIGIELEVETQEKNVGPFRADILCRDTVNGHYVLVENQLERTDHGHLGQLLTYAAGLDAVTVVWVAARFTEEHRAALDWLNRATSTEFNFFGLEIEVWRIGDSAMAPKFNAAPWRRSSSISSWFLAMRVPSSPRAICRLSFVVARSVFTPFTSPPRAVTSSALAFVSNWLCTL